MANRLSHTAVDKYLTCGQMYKLHYIDKIKPVETTSALVFGSAIDKAIEAMLQGVDPYATFIDHWTFPIIKNEKTDLREYKDITYYKSDIDLDLLTAEDSVYITSKLPREVDCIDDVISRIKQQEHRPVSPEVQAAYNLVGWHCLLRKGKLMLDAFARDIRPSIAKVVSTQRMVELENNDGDKTVGFVDLIVELQDGRTVILDIKTASSPYSEDSVRTSTQLAGYSFALEDEVPHQACGYVVLNKKVKKNTEKICSACGHKGEGTHKTCDAKINGKRCGGEWTINTTLDIDTQFLVDAISEKLKLDVIENYNVVNKAISAKLFPRNYSKCNDIYGQRCPFFDICHPTIGPKKPKT
jgi:hypothetical protein